MTFITVYTVIISITFIAMCVFCVKKFKENSKDVLNNIRILTLISVILIFADIPIFAGNESVLSKAVFVMLLTLSSTFLGLLYSKQAWINDTKPGGYLHSNPRKLLVLSMLYIMLLGIYFFFSRYFFNFDKQTFAVVMACTAGIFALLSIVIAVDHSAWKKSGGKSVKTAPGDGGYYDDPRRRVFNVIMFLILGVWGVMLKMRPKLFPEYRDTIIFVFSAVLAMGTLIGVVDYYIWKNKQKK